MTWPLGVSDCSAEGGFIFIQRGVCSGKAAARVALDLVLQGSDIGAGGGNNRYAHGQATRKCHRPILAA
jgi:hypothetical protein